MAKFKIKETSSFKVRLTLSDEEATTLYDLLYRHIGGEASCSGAPLGNVRDALAGSFEELRHKGVSVNTLRLYRDRDGSHSVLQTRQPRVKYGDEDWIA